MDHIAPSLENIKRNIEIVGADPVTLHGFTQVPNVILTNKHLSVGAKLASFIHRALRCEAVSGDEGVGLA